MCAEVRYQIPGRPLRRFDKLLRTTVVAWCRAGVAKVKKASNGSVHRFVYRLRGGVPRSTPRKERRQKSKNIIP